MLLSLLLNRVLGLQEQCGWVYGADKRFPLHTGKIYYTGARDSARGDNYESVPMLLCCPGCAGCNVIGRAAVAPPAEGQGEQQQCMVQHAQCEAAWARKFSKEVVHGKVPCQWQCPCLWAHAHPVRDACRCSLSHLSVHDWGVLSSVCLIPWPPLPGKPSSMLAVQFFCGLKSAQANHHVLLMAAVLRHCCHRVNPSAGIFLEAATVSSTHLMLGESAENTCVAHTYCLQHRPCTPHPPRGLHLHI